MSTQTVTTELDLDAIEARANAATDGPWETGEDGLVWTQRPIPGDPVSGSVELADAQFIAAARTDVPALVAEVRRLRAQVAAAREQLAKPCGSCHPCTNWADETWRAAGRKPPHVTTWDDAQAELKALRLVAEAAREWSRQRLNRSSRGGAFHEVCNALASTVDALPDPARHEGSCPGYGCPGCLADA